MNRTRFLKRIGPLLILLGAVLLVVLLMLTRSEPPRAEEQRGTLVDTETFPRTHQRISVPASGTVSPAVQTTILSQVSGRVIEVHPDLVPGGRIEEGEALLRIDPRDFELRVRQQRTQLQQARAEYRLELGRREVAEREWQLFAEELDPAQRDATLALREPQLNSAKASVDAAEAALSEAELALQRTTIEAPFDAIVLSEEVDRGQFVSPQSPIATLIGTDRLWIRAAIQADRLPYIDIDTQHGSIAHVQYDAGEFATVREGRVTRLLSELAEAGRMAHVLIEIPDPWEAERGSSAQVPLLLNAWVDITIEGNRRLSGIELPRHHLRSENEVWVVEQGRLAIRPVTIAWETADRVFVTEGLRPSDRVVTSRIASPAAGMALRLPDDARGQDAPRQVAQRESTPSGD